MWWQIEQCLWDCFAMWCGVSRNNYWYLTAFDIVESMVNTRKCSLLKMPTGTFMHDPDTVHYHLHAYTWHVARASTEGSHNYNVNYQTKFVVAVEYAIACYLAVLQRDPTMLFSWLLPIMMSRYLAVIEELSFRTRHRSCCWPWDARSQGITSNGIDIVFQWIIPKQFKIKYNHTTIRWSNLTHFLYQLS